MISTIPFMFEETLKKYSDKKTVFSGSDSLTFAQLYKKSLATACVLREMGVEKGDRVGLCMSKTLDQVIAILGVMYSNAVFVPILPKLKKSNILHIINDCGMKVLITDSERIREVSDYTKKVKLVIGHGQLDDGYPSIIELRKKISNQKKFFNCIGSNNAAIIYSSGSTGRPKGIVISHRNLFDGARIVSTYLHTTNEDRIAGILSFNFDYGLNQLWQTIYKGASLYLHELFFPNDFFDLLSNKKLTALPVMPVIITKMFDPRFYVLNKKHDFSALKYICTSGGSVSSKMLENLKKTFSKSKIYLMYGITEAFRSTYLPPEQINKRPASIGKAIPDVEIYVLDENNNICPPDILGELVHRGGCITKGYWNAPEKTSEVFREIPLFPGEKVFFSGDLVKTDEEGYLYFISRKDSMIKTYGYRVSPTEIEEESCKHKKITASVSFGIPNPEIGEDIVLAYTTIDRKQIDREVLIQYLKKALPDYMVPVHIIHMKDFSTTGNQGKIDRMSVENIVKEQLDIQNKLGGNKH